MSKRHSRCFLLSGLPFPAFSLFILTSAKPQVQLLVSKSKETSLKTPSLSEDEPVAAISVTYFTYKGRSLNRSRSCGTRTTLSTPGDETCQGSENRSVYIRLVKYINNEVDNNIQISSMDLVKIDWC